MTAPVAVRLYARDPISQAGIAAALRCQPEIRLLPENGDEQARVAIVALDVVDKAGRSVLHGLRGDGCDRIVLVINELSDQDLLDVVEAGVCAIVWRWEATASWLAHTVTKAAAGEAALPSTVLSRLLKQVSRLQHHVLAPRGLSFSGLSDREADVLRLAADGFDTDDIARKLAYSKRTVSNILHAVTIRYQLRNRTHAVAYVIREGLI
ncbi:MAG TPA: LuxR C-terminal-related transcriptional regulator [Pseudonocardiaceae bacterium]|nr:LuxR C-terminal-related transcriptional regulator [Pseudonocardiaceae bacterium]